MEQSSRLSYRLSICCSSFPTHQSIAILRLRVVPAQSKMTDDIQQPALNFVQSPPPNPTIDTVILHDTCDDGQGPATLGAVSLCQGPGLVLMDSHETLGRATRTIADGAVEREGQGKQ